MTLQLSEIHRKYGVQFPPFDTMKLCRQSNLTSGVVWRDIIFEVFMPTALSYDGIFQDKYDIHFSDARTSDISSDMRSSKFLSNESRLMYIHYASVGMLMMEQKELPVSVETVSTEKESRTSRGVTHLDEFRLSVQSSEVALRLIHVAHH